MRPALILGFVATVASIAIATEMERVHEIGITASVPTVTVTPRRAGHILMRIPSLTYALTVAVDCGADWQPDSVSISVADSGASLDAKQLQAGKELKLELRIPSNQIAPLRIEKFCIADDTNSPDATIQNRITIAGVMSAQASLRCATAFEQATIYVTELLDVVLECGAPDPEKNEPGSLRFILGEGDCDSK